MGQAIMACIILATIFGGIALVVVVFFWGIKTLRGTGGPQSKEQQMEETRSVQEMYHALTKMEERIAALETILLDYKRKEKNHEAV